MEQKKKLSSMSTYDLADLRNLLRLLDIYYETHGKATELMDSIRSELSNRLDKKIISLDDIFNVLNNPRRAGRKSHYSSAVNDEIKELRKKGYTLIRIANELGVSYSHVQRVLSV